MLEISWKPDLGMVHDIARSLTPSERSSSSAIDPFVTIKVLPRVSAGVTLLIPRKSYLLAIDGTVSVYMNFCRRLDEGFFQLSQIAVREVGTSRIVLREPAACRIGGILKSRLAPKYIIIINDNLNQAARDSLDSDET